MILMMGLWVFFGFIVHMFVGPLNKIVIAGFPLGFYMAAQGSLIIFVVALFWFGKRQNQRRPGQPRRRHRCRCRGSRRP